MSWGRAAARAAAWSCGGALALALAATTAQACPPALAAAFAAQEVDADGLEALQSALRQHAAAPDPA